MRSTDSHQQLLQAISHLSEHQASVVLQFISSLETLTNNHLTSPQTVLERMGGYPEFSLEGSGDLSDRDVRKKVISDIVKARQQARTNE
jgi:hypothetical protein